MQKAPILNPSGLLPLEDGDNSKDEEIVHAFGKNLKDRVGAPPPVDKRPELSTIIEKSTNNNIRYSLEDETDKFEVALAIIINEITSGAIATPKSELVKREIDIVMNWFRDSIIYNLPHGKRNRGLTVVMTHKILANHLNKCPEIDKAAVIGWCIEILQTHFLILDDIMDESTTRRGQKCWHLKRNVGHIAINDSFFMQMSIFYLIDKHFSNTPVHQTLTSVFHETMLKTVIGQQLDLLSAKPNERPNLSLFNIEKYNTIVDYKTAIYSFSAPIRLGMILSGVTDPNVHEQADCIARKMGKFFQIQDDYLDCFGDPIIMGKIGTDIEEGKCCWPVVTALSLANNEQKQIIESNYGLKDPKNVGAIKQVYKELKIEEIYRQYESDVVNELCVMIDRFCKQTQLPGEIFYCMLLKICGRKK